MAGKETDKYRAAKAFHNHAGEYDRWFGESLVYGIEEIALKSLRTQMDTPKMEIGVGPGHFARNLGVGVGIDPAWALLKLASERGIRCCQAFGEQLPVKDRVIGTIYVLFTLCFVGNPQKTLLECSRSLKEGGHLVIGMIPSGSAWGRSLAVKKKAGHSFYKYAHFYTIAAVEELLAKANMRIIEFNSTLYQAPGCVEQNEAPREVLDEQAGFVVIVATRERN